MNEVEENIKEIEPFINLFTVLINHCAKCDKEKHCFTRAFEAMGIKGQDIMDALQDTTMRCENFKEGNMGWKIKMEKPV